MNRTYFLTAFAALISIALISIAAPAAPPTDQSAPQTIYKCYRDGYDPPVCVPVAHAAGDYDPEAIDIAEVVAASLAAQSGKTQRIMRKLGKTSSIVDGPMTDGCANSHGQSGCCRLIPGGHDGIVYVECG